MKFKRKMTWNLKVHWILKIKPLYFEVKLKWKYNSKWNIKSISNEIQSENESEFHRGWALPVPSFCAHLQSSVPAILLANMADNHEATWTDDDNLKEVWTKYVQQGLQRSEALDFLRREFPQYAWSMCSLDRRLRHFNIF